MDASRPLTLLAMTAMLAGCATSMTEAQCRDTDWYKLGERDGRYYGAAQIESYSAQCGRVGVRPDESLYMAGWREGYSEGQKHGGGGGGGGY